MACVHVIGAGLAGLAAAIKLIDAGYDIMLYETSPWAGGRCRSYHDRDLCLRIDNGNHLLLSGNRAAFAFLEKLGTRHTLKTPVTPVFPFFDYKTGERWVLRPSMGRLPFWLFDKKKRVPGTNFLDYVKLFSLAFAPAHAVVADVLAHNTLYHRLIAPLSISALNTQNEQGAAQLLYAVMRETLLAGGDKTIPAFPANGLSESFIDPALAYLAAGGASIKFSTRVSALISENNRVTALTVPEGAVNLAAQDKIVLAVPANIAATLLPGIAAPDQFESILNIHYKTEAVAPESGFVGLINALAEWVFVKPHLASITLSAANHLIDEDADQLAAKIWPEVVAALQLPAYSPLPPYRVVKEKRATFLASPAQATRRANVSDGPQNLALAGDWTATGLPATIEGAIRSGNRAAAYLQKM
jgi:squalene-associated FAD-dependent desaturase